VVYYIQTSEVAPWRRRERGLRVASYSLQRWLHGGGASEVSEWHHWHTALMLVGDKLDLLKISSSLATLFCEVIDLNIW
jgi:hypothetical protein